MAEAYLSQTGFTYFWGKLEGILDNKVETTDPRLTDARTPTAHTHGSGSDHRIQF